MAMVVEDKRCSRRVMPRADLILLYLRAPTRLMFSTPDCISSRVAFGNYNSQGPFHGRARYHSGYNKGATLYRLYWQPLPKPERTVTGMSCS